MPESSHKVIHPESIYDVIELIGTRSSIIQYGGWTSLASETTARRLPSDKRTNFWSR